MKKSRHICIVTSGRPRDVFYGGEENFSILFRNWLLEKGNQVTIIGRKLFLAQTIKSKEIILPPSKEEYKQPRVIHIPYIMFQLSMLVTSLFSLLLILHTNKKSKISLIHAQDTGFGGFCSLISARILKVPLVITSHGVRYFSLQKTIIGVSKIVLPFNYWLDRLIAKGADLLIALNPSIKEYYLKIGIKNEKTRIIPIGIFTENFQVDEYTRKEMRKKLCINEDEIVLGFIGRLSIEKNLFTLLQSFEVASRQNEKIKLLFAGTGPLKSKLNVLIQSKLIGPRTIVTETRSNVDDLLSAIDIFVLPSYVEGCPTILLEAMCMGKAIIASNIPAIRQIVEDKKDAILFNPYKSEELAKAIIKLSNDVGLIDKLGNNVKTKVKIYDKETVFPQINDAYLEVCDTLKG